MALTVNVTEQGVLEARWEIEGDGGAADVSFAMPHYPDKTVSVDGIAAESITLTDSDSGTTLTNVDGDPAVFAADGVMVIRENPRSITMAITGEDGSTDISVVVIGTK